MILSCFSEIVDQNCRLCSRSMCRGENFGLKQELKPMFLPTRAPGPGWTRTWTLNPSLSEGRDPLSRRSGAKAPLPYLTTKVKFQSPADKTHSPPLLYISLPPLTQKSLTKPQIWEIDMSHAFCLPVVWPHNKAFSFLKSQCHSIGFSGHRTASPWPGNNFLPP